MSSCRPRTKASFLRGGLHSYNLPNGFEFQNGERGGTTELFVSASTEVLETTSYLSSTQNGTSANRPKLTQTHRPSL